MQQARALDLNQKRISFLSKLQDKTILEHNIEQLEKIGLKITLVIRDKGILKNITKTKIELIKGGKTRTLS